MNENEEVRYFKVKESLTKCIEDAEKTSSTSSLILCVCLIDALSGFFNGYIGQRGENKEFFKKFSKKYLPNFDSDKLYTLRCDVVHSYSNSLGFMIFDNEEFSKKFPDVESIFGSEVIRVDELRKDLKISLDKYFSDVRSDNELLDKFNKRFEFLGILIHSDIPTVTDLDGNMLNCSYEDIPESGTPGLKVVRINPTKFVK